MRRSILVTSLATLALVAAMAPIPACESGTGGRLVTLDIAFESVPAAGTTDPSVFTTRTGWAVTLDEAVVVVGPVYGYAPADPPATASIEQRLERLLVPVAYAHGGIDPLNGRRVLAELLDPAVVDARTTGVVLAERVEGEAGPADELALVLDPPDATTGVATHAHHAWVAGTAARGTTTVAFEGGLDLPDEGVVRRVEGIALAGDIDDAVTLVVEAHLTEWLADAHFDQLTTAAPSGRMEITPESQVRGAWYLGIRSHAAWTARIDAPIGGL